MLNKKLKKDIVKMESSKRQKQNWGYQIENLKKEPQIKDMLGIWLRK
mgnify:CR=1 FL=1